MSLKLSTITLLLSIKCIESQDWNYHDLGPDVWSDRYPTCAGHAQSPINILTACTKYEPFAPFELSNLYNLSLNFTLLNIGNTVIGTVNYADNITLLTVTGGGLNGTFQFSSFHLHWGENRNSGGEHQINGMKYSGEIHLVFTNPLNNQSMVLATFMQSLLDTNDSSISFYDGVSESEWQKYFDITRTLTTKNDSTSINLSFGLLLGHNKKEFWRYRGSLTTPPCTEGIIWTVFRRAIIFRESQFQNFRRSIYLEYHREPQRLNNRTTLAMIVV